jgi:hypothetical protein
MLLALVGMNSTTFSPDTKMRSSEGMMRLHGVAHSVITICERPCSSLPKGSPR